MRQRGIAQNAAFALVGDLAAKGGTMAVTMVAARGLGTPEFALLASCLATATVLTAALDLGSQTLLTRDGVGGAQARGGLLRSLAIARTPLFGVAVGAAFIAGLATGRVLEALATVALAAAGAAQLSVTGAIRAAQDLRPEAVAKLATGALTLLAASACVLLAPRAGDVLLVLAAASVLGLAPMRGAARRAITRARGPRPWVALRRAAPLGAMALATLVYYRSGTIALSLFSTPEQTARFAAVSTVAWALLTVANAVTTGLLPRLAAGDAADRAAVTRRALVWVTAMAAALAAAVALLARPLLSLLLGARYASGAPTLTLLCGATVLIAPAGVLGTALVAAGRTRALAMQVAVSLAVNLATLVVLVPRLGAIGAAAATLACEAAALGLLFGAALRPQACLLGNWRRRGEPAARLAADGAR